MLVANYACMIAVSLVILLSLSVASFPATLADAASTASPLDKVQEFVKAQMPADALQTLSSYRPTASDFFQYHSLYAQALVQSQKLYDAIEHYRLAYLYAPIESDKERLLFARADAYMRMRYYSEAVLCFDLLLRQFPRSSFVEQSHLGIATARFRLNEYRGALRHFEQAGASFAALAGTANALQALGRTEEAREIYQRLLHSDAQRIQESQETLYYLGENFRAMGKSGDARVYLSAVHDPGLASRAQIGLGRIALAEKAGDVAARLFGSAAESPDRDVRRQALLLQAEALLSVNKTDDAVASLRELRNTQPYGKEYDAALLMLTRIARAAGRSEESLSYLKELLHRRSPPAEAVDELEAVLLEAKERNREEFLTLWKAAGRWLMDPSRQETLISVAEGLRGSGRPFFDLCSWLIKYGPNEVKARTRLLLADAYARQGDAAEAANYLDRAGVRTHSDEALRVHGKIAFLTEEFGKTVEFLTAVQEPNDEDIRILLVALEAMRAAPAAAIAYCDRAFQKRGGTASLYIRFADLLFDQGMRSDALRYYQAGTAAKSDAGKQTAAEREWALYRTMLLTSGEQRESSRAVLERGASIAGRIAALHAKGAELRATAFR